MRVTHLPLVLTRYGVHKMEKIIHDIETNTVTVETLSAKEVKEIEANAAASLAKQTEEMEKLETTLAAKAQLLTKLGITNDEAKLFLS